MTRLAKLTLIVLAAVATLVGQNVQNANIRGMKNRVFSVIDYGATGNGTTDDTAAIQRAIDAAEVSGGLVDFPRGTYKISRLTVTAPKVYLKCAGRRTTGLQSTVTTGKVISFYNATATTYSGGGMENCTLYGVANLTQVNPPGTETGLAVEAYLDTSSIVVSGNVATVNTSTASGIAAGAAVSVAGATVDADLNATYTVASTPTANSFTFPTVGVSDGTYTEATLGSTAMLAGTT